MKALILAGSQEGENHLGQLEGNKALIKIHDKEMITYIIEALRKLDFIDEIAVVGSKTQLSPIKDRVDTLVEGGSTLTQNVLKGSQIFEDNEKILLLTSDIPMITPESIKDFAEKALALKAEFCYPIISKEENEKKYPGVRRTYVKLKDGTFTGGNIVLVKAGTLKRCINQAEAFLAYRKKPWKLARILGISFLIKLILGKLTIVELERRVSDLFNMKARAVFCPYPEIGTDVDKVSDLELATRVLLSTD